MYLTRCNHQKSLTNANKTCWINYTLLSLLVSDTTKSFLYNTPRDFKRKITSFSGNQQLLVSYRKGCKPCSQIFRLEDNCFCFVMTCLPQDHSGLVAPGQEHKDATDTIKHSRHIKAKYQNSEIHSALQVCTGQSFYCRGISLI